MRFNGKKERAYKCLVDYKNDSIAKEYKQLAEIFLSMIDKDNKRYIFVGVGKKMSKTRFLLWLSWESKNFGVAPVKYKDEVQIIIRDMDNPHTLVIFNLSFITDLHITTTEDSNRYYHEIYLKYNEVNYKMSIVIDKE